MPRNDDHPIAMRARVSDGVTTAKVLITHPMEAGDQVDGKADNPPTPHFIQEIICRVGERTVLTALWGENVAPDPYLAFKFKGAKPGDILTLHWVDNLGHGAQVETVIS